jgi:hypothetical protein
MIIKSDTEKQFGASCYIVSLARDLPTFQISQKRVWVGPGSGSQVWAWAFTTYDKSPNGPEASFLKRGWRQKKFSCLTDGGAQLS